MGVFGVVLACFLLFPISFVFAIQLCSSITAFKSKSWPSVDGKILSSVFYETMATAEEAAGFHPRILYEYTVGGTSYESYRVDLRQSALVFFTKKPADRMVSRYTPGATVSVYYNPKIPQLSVLEPGIVFDFMFYVVAFSVPVVAALCVVLIFWISPLDGFIWAIFAVFLGGGAASGYFLNRGIESERQTNRI